MAGAGPVVGGGYAGIIDEFSKCWGYLDHLGKVAKDASYFMEGTMKEHSMEGTKEGYTMEGTKGSVGFLAGNSIEIEKSKIDFIATLVEKIMNDYNKALEPKVGIRCNFYNRGFCRKGSTCDFEHPTKMCEQYTKEGDCSRRHCNDRHIYKCKYFQSQQGCFRGSSCEYLHVNEGSNIEKDHNEIDDGKNVEVVDTTNTGNEEPDEVDDQIKMVSAISKDIPAATIHLTTENGKK